MKKNKTARIPYSQGGTTISDPHIVLRLTLVNEDYEKALAESRKPVVKNVRLFGVNYNGSIDSNPDNIEVATSSYTHVKKYLLSNKMTITGFRVRVPDCEDLSKDEDIKKSLVWLVRKADIFGQSAQYPISLMGYFDEKQEQKGMVDVKPYKITIDGDAEIVVPVWSKVVITFYIEPKKREISPEYLLELIQKLGEFVHKNVKDKKSIKVKTKKKGKKKAKSSKRK
jgi:hypothetical protein